MLLLPLLLTNPTDARRHAVRGKMMIMLLTSSRFHTSEVVDGGGAGSQDRGNHGAGCSNVTPSDTPKSQGLNWPKHGTDTGVTGSGQA